MDLKEFMSYAPPEYKPTIISPQSIREDAAKRLNKKVEEVTEEEYQEELEMYRAACMTPADLMSD